MIDSEEIKQMKGVQESEASWQRRKKFLIVFQSKFPQERLNTLSYCYVNVLMFGCRYSEKLMDELYEMACDVANYQWDDPVVMTKWNEIFEGHTDTGVKKIKKKKYKTMSKVTKPVISKNMKVKVEDIKVNLEDEDNKVNSEEGSDEDISMIEDFSSIEEFPVETNKCQLSFNNSSSSPDFICPVLDLNLNTKAENSSEEKTELHISKFRPAETDNILITKGDINHNKSSPRKELNKIPTRKLVCDTLLSIINQKDKKLNPKSPSSKIMENENVKKMYHAFKDSKTSENQKNGKSKTDKSNDKVGSQITDQKQENTSEKVKQNDLKISQKTKDKLSSKTKDKKASNSQQNGQMKGKSKTKVSQKSRGKEKREKFDPNSIIENKNLPNEDLKDKQTSVQSGDKTKTNDKIINQPEYKITKSQKPVEKVKSKVKDNLENTGTKGIKSDAGNSKTKEKSDINNNLKSPTVKGKGNEALSKQEKIFSQFFFNKNKQESADKFKYRSQSPHSFQDNYWSGYSSRVYGNGTGGAWDSWSCNNMENWYRYDSGYNCDPIGRHNRSWYTSAFTRENYEHQFTSGANRLPKSPEISMNFPFYDHYQHNRSYSMQIQGYSGSRQRRGRSGYPVEMSEDNTGYKFSQSKKSPPSSMDSNNNAKDIKRDSLLVSGYGSPTVPSLRRDIEWKGGKGYESKFNRKLNSNGSNNKTEGAKAIEEGKDNSVKSTQNKALGLKRTIDRSYKSIDHEHNKWLQSVLDEIQKT